MTLEEYESDQKFLLAKVVSQGKMTVESYLRARNYTDNELLLLRLMTEDQIAAKCFDYYENFFNIDPSILDHADEESPPSAPPKVPWQDELDLATILNRALKKIKPSPFEKIKLRYLTSPGKSKHFEEAERFMLDFGYFRKDGSWDKIGLQDLITFLNLLITAGILKYSNEKDMNDYFSKRYKMDSIGALIRLNKLKQHNKFDLYVVLIVRLGLKIEDLRSR